jgi:hypothetical protein
MSTEDFKKPATFTAELYDKKVSIEVDHSDLDIFELFEVFHKLTLASGYMDGSWREAVSELAELYKEEDADGV